MIQLDDLPASISGDHAAILTPSLRRNDTLRAWASRYARVVVDRCQGNKRQACRVLGISYHTLQTYLQYRPDEFEAGPDAATELPGAPSSEANAEEETAALG